MLLGIAFDPTATVRQIADAVGLTERSVHSIIADLVKREFVEKERVGRRSRYRLVEDTPLRHPLLRKRTLGDFLQLMESPA